MSTGGEKIAAIEALFIYRNTDEAHKDGRFGGLSNPARILPIRGRLIWRAKIKATANGFLF